MITNIVKLTEITTFHYSGTQHSQQLKAEQWHHSCG